MKYNVDGAPRELFDQRTAASVTLKLEVRVSSVARTPNGIVSFFAM
jgi:hypothetical protein